VKGQSKVFGVFNIIDFACLLVILISILGFSMAKAQHAGVNNIIKGMSKIDITIYLAGVKTIDTNLFAVDQPSSLTIRNQPVYPPMTIVAIKHWPKQISFLANDGKKAISLDDPAQPLVHDFLVTVRDDAEITADGYVVRGNKLKVANQVELESFKYRIPGVVVNIEKNLAKDNK
jgi:hypothetical protein